MRILFLGDIVGRQARGHVIAETATLKENLECDFVITNCENSAGGFGVTPDIPEVQRSCGKVPDPRYPKHFG